MSLFTKKKQKKNGVAIRLSGS